MALPAFQRDDSRLLADTRIRSGESYVAGGAALNELLRAPRLSRDIDLFHDTEAALASSWAADRGTLEGAGCRLTVVRERPTFVEAEVRRGLDSLVIQWDTGREIVASLPADEAGRAVLTTDGVPYRREPGALREALRRGELRYHEGRIRGAFPRIVR